MIERSMPDTIFYECPVCDDETEHQILKGRMGKATIEGTFKCNGCGRVTSETIKIPELLEVPVVFSDGDVSEVTKTTIESNDVIAIEDEFFLDDGRRVCVTHIDVKEGATKKKVLATNVKKLWVKQFDILSIKVSVNDDRKTYSLRVEAEPDDEFVVGTQLEFEDFDCLIHAIKTKHSLVKRGVAEARDITRVYGKIRKKRYEVLDLDEDDEDYDDFVFDDDDDDYEDE
ncbi:MAG: HVO_0476 family zinc finger protein [Candidatus Methanomethylophilaceae archaeon]|nr:HVO_0476 family zinc finger protein [Candidatus Methanomethylophilaceae archaeon]